MNNLSQNKIRVRFAPSPTGYLHLGSLRVALFNWLFARHNNGDFLIRIEDTDFERSNVKYVNSILDPLKWVNIESDEPIVFQSKRLDIYNKVIHDLIAKDLVYKCYCSQQDLENRLLSNKNLEYKKYDRLCRYKSPKDSDSYVIRFKLPENSNKITFKDLIRGKLEFDIEQLDDFIIFRSDGIPTYNFAVVVDDHYMSITHVLRGEEHISNTPKQILLYKACNFKLPSFGHFPLILSPEGGKLSKRHAATSVEYYKNEGFLPDALCNYLVRLGWAYKDQEIFTKEELIKYFSLENVGKSGAVFDIRKLEWVNSIYIKNLSAENIYDYIVNNIDKNIFYNFKNWDKNKILKLIDLYKERVKTLRELLNNIQNLYNFNIKNINISLNEFHFDKLKLINNLNIIIKYLEKENNYTHDNLAFNFKAICKKENIKLAEIAQPIRIALTGQISSPGIFDLLSIIHKEDSIKRIKDFIELLDNY